MSKTIFRVEKNANNPFVMMDRRLVEDPNLTWKAKGILAYLLSRPDDWIVRIGDLIKRSPDGAYAVRAGIRELVKAGNITRTEERQGGRFKQYVLTVHELPLRGFPHARKPQAKNRGLNKTDVTETEGNKRGPKGSEIPEVAVVRSIMNRYPVKALWEEVAKSVQTVQARLGREVTRDDLAGFYRAWCKKGYNPMALTWLEWAVSGQIPVNGNWKSKEPQGVTAAREWLEGKSHA